MSACARFKMLNNIISGSIFGDLYLMRKAALHVDRDTIEGFKINEIKKEDMALTRGYSAHTSMIQCVEIMQDKYIFSTAVSD